METMDDISAIRRDDSDSEDELYPDSEDSWTSLEDSRSRSRSNARSKMHHQMMNTSKLEIMVILFRLWMTEQGGSVDE